MGIGDEVIGLSMAEDQNKEVATEFLLMALNNPIIDYGMEM